MPTLPVYNNERCENPHCLHDSPATHYLIIHYPNSDFVRFMCKTCAVTYILNNANLHCELLPIVTSAT